MKAVAILEQVKVLSIEPRSNQDNTITWNEVVFLQDQNCNKLTCSERVAEKLSSGDIVDLLLDISEVPKAYKNGSGAYIETKFKIIEVLK